MADDEQPDPLIGQTLLDKLKVIRVLGGGGMGSVYEVEHLYTSHHRALKLIRPEYVKRRNYMTRLVREASVAGKLQTPYVVETYDAGLMEDGSAYVLMELLHGKLFIDLLDKDQVLAVPRLVGIMAQVCEGVAVAHAAGIIHRDLKPENIFLVEHPTGHERVKILDFGISKFRDKGDEASRLTAEGTILGTPFYMSPEQAAAKEVDERTDVYSVGVMLYEALTGRLPFDAKSVGALFIKIAAGEYLPLRHFRPDIDPDFEAVVDKAMARDRDHRFQTMEALRTALLRWAPADLRVRTKTISDSPKPMRGTVGYDERRSDPGHNALPDPVPGGKTVAMGGPPEEMERPDSVDRFPSSERPPAPSSAERAPSAFAGLSRQLPWILGAAAAIAVGAVLLLSGGEEPEAGADEPPAEVSEPPRADPEPADEETPPEMEEGDAEAEAAEIAADAQEPAQEVGEAGEAEGEALEETAPAGTPRPIHLRRRDGPTPMGDPTPAQEAGLEGNPYGMR